MMEASLIRNVVGNLRNVERRSVRRIDGGG
jgi:hypothetical protein